MKEVNPFFIDALLGPITGLADDDEAVSRYLPFDSNSAGKVKGVIRRLLVPHFLGFDQKSKSMAKLSLSYYLSKPDTDFLRIYDSALLPFSAPNDPRNFFLWIWEELFPNENYHVNDLSQYTEIKDMYAPNKIKMQF